MTVRTMIGGIACLTAVAVVLLASEGPRAESAAAKRGGYALSGELCGPFPKVRISMRPGYCAGLVAANEDGLVGARKDGVEFPRAIVQIPDTRFFVVADMVGWEKKGRLLLLDPQAAKEARLKVLITGLDNPHGLAIGIDRRVYASTVDRIFRFDPLAANPAGTMEVIVKGLPGHQPTLPDKTKIKKNLHPLKHFVFDRTGRLYVNIGAPTDACTKQPSNKACASGEGDSPFAAIWVFTPPAGGIFPALTGPAANPKQEVYPKHEVYAEGLRNSMALAVHPRFPDAGYAFLQGENARDLEDPNKPNEEINALERGKHYGWPYCYDLATVSSEYAAFLKTTATRYRNLCNNAALYKRPHSLMPPHGAPLAMFYYEGEKFPELKGKLIVGLHGYRPTGNRVLAYDVDEHGFPVVSPPPVRYSVNCTTPRVYRTDAEPQVPAARPTELIFGWHTVTGVRPRGTPVGMTVDADGAIWLVEDKNKTILRIDAEPPANAVGALSCDARNVSQIVAMVAKSPANAARLDQVRAGLIEPHCAECHGRFGIGAGMSNAQKNDAVLRFILEQDSWVYPGDLKGSRLHNRVWGLGSEMIMPQNGHELLKNPSYRQLLTALDQLIAAMPAGARK
jgi:glucose/arabinose dehydrogenase